MFQSLRENSTLYILHKDATPYLETASVVRVGAPMPAPVNPAQPPQPFAVPQMVVDVVVNKPSGQETFQLPANCVSATLKGNGATVVAMTREGIADEISAMEQRSNEAIASYEYHKNIVVVCGQLKKQLYPEMVEREKQEAKIKELESTVASLSTSMNAIMAQNQQMLEFLKGEKKSKKE